MGLGLRLGLGLGLGLGVGVELLVRSRPIPNPSLHLAEELLLLGGDAEPDHLAHAHDVLAQRRDEHAAARAHLRRLVTGSRQG